MSPALSPTLVLRSGGTCAEVGQVEKETTAGGGGGRWGTGNQSTRGVALNWAVRHSCLQEIVTLLSRKCSREEGGGLILPQGRGHSPPGGERSKLEVCTQPQNP